jgi:RTX calcium-binding nonapeptide repeat (4 copies)
VLFRELIRLGLRGACFGPLLIPCPAVAATVSVSEGQMIVATTGAGRNVIDVTPDGLAFRVYDSFDTVEAGEGCVSLSPNEAVCGGMVMVIRVDGGDGDDLLGLWDVKVPVIARGGDGNDLIETGDAADEIHSGSGRDAVEGGKGNDTLMGGADGDRVEGGPGRDGLDGEAGDDVVLGGDGDDDASGGNANDLVNGGAGDDQLAGGAGTNAIVATLGSDTVTTGIRADTVYSRGHSLTRLRCRFTRRSPRKDCSRTHARVVESRPPKVWPQSSEAKASDAKASGRAGAANVGVLVFARRPSNAKKLSVQVDTEKIRRRRVCIRIFDSERDFLGRFPKRVSTPKDSVKSPRLAAHYATGKLRKKGCRRRMT